MRKEDKFHPNKPIGLPGTPKQKGAGEPFWGMETVKCGVLYLSLEDTLARIQSRLMKLTDEAPSNLRFAVTAGTIGNGLDNEIGSYLHTYPDTKLIIIDTLQKIRSQKNNASGGMYASDYEDDIHLVWR